MQVCYQILIFSSRCIYIYIYLFTTRRDHIKTIINGYCHLGSGNFTKVNSVIYKSIILVFY